MPTPEQIEAVARAIATVGNEHQPEYIGVFPIHTEQAAAAIAAYEATRPKVSDADLLDTWIEAKTKHRGTDYATDLVAIRAVRRRLEGLTDGNS